MTTEDQLVLLSPAELRARVWEAENNLETARTAIETSHKVQAEAVHVMRQARAEISDLQNQLAEADRKISQAKRTFDEISQIAKLPVEPPVAK
jgi:predicted RNase H-like nuclease (RuvC/YqgF family)